LFSYLALLHKISCFSLILTENLNVNKKRPAVRHLIAVITSRVPYNRTHLSAHNNRTH